MSPSDRSLYHRTGAPAHAIEYSADVTRRRDLIERETELSSPLLCPELLLHLITERCRLWRAREAELKTLELPDPFWAFAWPGGQALARYLFDRPGCVRGKSVLDFGTGSGIVALAAAKAGARSVLASDTDEYAVEAARLNAEVNGCALEATSRDLIGADENWEVVLAGDMCYEAELSASVLAWLEKIATRGGLVLIADPARGFLPRERLDEVAAYDAPGDVDSDGRIKRRTAIFRLLPKDPGLI